MILKEHTHESTKEKESHSPSRLQRSMCIDRVRSTPIRLRTSIAREFYRRHSKDPSPQVRAHAWMLAATYERSYFQMCADRARFRTFTHRLTKRRAKAEQS